MRNDLKIGIIVGVLVVIGVIIFLVSPGGDSASNKPGNPPPPPPPPVIKTTTPAPPETKPVEIVVVPEEVQTPPEEKVEVPVIPPVEPDKPVEPEPVVRPPRYHIVKEGDSLSSISEQYFGHGKYWTVIHQTNKNIIQNPDHLQLGWKLLIPYPDEVTDKP